MGDVNAAVALLNKKKCSNEQEISLLLANIKHIVLNIQEKMKKKVYHLVQRKACLRHNTPTDTHKYTP